ncbi:STAS domain-containing protein [Streptomyces subrutilus]|uniref:STAS domain-containing protein n=1 Tax=Streptomyces subrutilus TaxID=36818 RepID=UPI0033D88004
MERRNLYNAGASPCRPHPAPQAEAVYLPGTGHVAMVRLSGESDAASIHVFREVLAATAEDRLIVDLTGVTFADSSLLHALLDAHRGLILAGPLPRQLHHLLEATGTTTRFTTAPDLDTACETLPRVG